MFFSKKYNILWTSCLEKEKYLQNYFQKCIQNPLFHVGPSVTTHNSQIFPQSFNLLQAYQFITELNVSLDIDPIVANLKGKLK